MTTVSLSNETDRRLEPNTSALSVGTCLPLFEGLCGERSALGREHTGRPTASRPVECRAERGRVFDVNSGRDRFPWARADDRQQIRLSALRRMYDVRSRCHFVLRSGTAE